MRNIYKLLFLFLSLTVIINAQDTINGRLIVVSHDTLNYTIKAQINMNTGTGQLGSSTMIITFDTTAMTFPASPVNGADYSFLNFNGNDYSKATITRPKKNEIWFNIELTNNNNGTEVADSPNWTDVATLNFKILNQSGTSKLQWQTRDANWAIYGGDNSTLWKAGTWSDLNKTATPVELTSFSASLDRNIVVLNWQTVSESSNLDFEIQRAAKVNNYQWEKIGSEKGFQNSHAVNNYTFVDHSPRSDSSFYRLKQIEDNGNYKYSKIVKINLAPLEYHLYQNYPNPFNPSTHIKFTLPEKNMVTIKVFDITGKEVATLLHETKNAGDYSLNFNARNLSSGVYVYQISSGNFVQAKKMLLLK